MANPTAAQLSAVHSALYKPARLSKIAHLTDQISRLMNLDPLAPLQPNDTRNPPGSGPNWFIPATGKANVFVLDAVKFCDQLVETLMDIHTDLSKVGLPESDKQHLLTAVKEEARSWSARSKLWSAPGKPDVESALAQIGAHVTASLAAASQVRPYLKKKRDIEIK